MYLKPVTEKHCYRCMYKQQELKKIFKRPTFLSISNMPMVNIKHDRDQNTKLKFYGDLFFRFFNNTNLSGTFNLCLIFLE